MAIEAWNYTNEPTVVVGGRGEFGTRVKDGLERGLHIVDVTPCELGDPIQDLLTRSRIAFFATDEDTTRDILHSARDKFTAGYVVLEGASTKGKLISPLERLDREGVSAASVHLGIRTNSSWAGARFWECRVGPNSDRALMIADGLSTHFDMRRVPINLRDHQKVQKVQVHTFVGQLASVISLRNRRITLEDLDTFATANSQLGVLATARGIGQKKGIIAEVLSSQPKNALAIIDSNIKALEELRGKLSEGKEGLEEYIEALQHYHGESTGELQEMFGDTEFLVEEILRMAMYNLQFSTTEDRPGTLLRLLAPLAERAANLMHISSTRIPPTKEEIQQGADAKEGTVLFKTAVDLKTIDSEKEREINHELEELGCEVKKKK